MARPGLLVACLLVGCNGPSGRNGGHTEPTLAFANSTTAPSMGAVVALGHLDADAKLDAALGNGVATGGAILLGNGDATFRPGATIDTAGNAVFIAVGDFNSDGARDLAVALGNPPGPSLSLLQNKGDGTFTPPAGVNIEGGVSMVAVGDWNGDGHPDVALASAATTQVVTISFGMPMQRKVTVAQLPRYLVAADFNGDSKPDLAVAGGSGTQGAIDVLLGNGDGSFTAAHTYPLGRQLSSLAAADFDGDGKLDLLVGDGAGDATLTFAKGQGDGSFALTPSVIVEPGAGVVALAVADFNGGGHLDAALLVAPSAGQAFIDVVLGSGDGRFGPPARYGSFDSAGLGAAALAAGDLDGDGKPDLVVAHGKVEIFKNASH